MSLKKRILQSYLEIATCIYVVFVSLFHFIFDNLNLREFEARLKEVFVCEASPVPEAPLMVGIH